VVAVRNDWAPKTETNICLLETTSAVLVFSMFVNAGIILIRTVSSFKDLTLFFLSNAWQCAVDEQTRKAVYDCGGLDTLVSLLSRQDNKKLLAAVTGAIWKCAISEYNVRR